MGMADGGFVALFAASYWAAPPLSRWCRLPLITVYLGLGLLAQLLLKLRMPKQLHPAHEAALACITFAAGSELVISQIRQNARAICWVSLMLTLSSLILVSLSVLLLMVSFGGSAMAGLSSGGLELKVVIAGLASVVAIGRSPSSAIAVVSDLKADGPFTQQVLSITMCTDVIVIVLFTAAAELSLGILSSNGSSTAAAMTLRFLGHTMLQLGLSALHGTVLTLLCLATLRMPHFALRTAAILLVGGYAFEAEAMLEHLVVSSGWSAAIRVEPMLACIIAGFLVGNRTDEKTSFGSLLNAVMPPLLAFFFFSTGGFTPELHHLQSFAPTPLRKILYNIATLCLMIGSSMRVSALRHSWPVALSLFVVRLFSLWVGNWLGCTLAGSTAVHRRYGWLAYVTQAGITLGLTDEIAELFPIWGPPLQATLISGIVLNQLIGPPLFEFALRGADEAGRRTMDDEDDMQLASEHERTIDEERADEDGVEDASELQESPSCISPARESNLPWLRRPASRESKSLLPSPKKSCVATFALGSPS